MGLALLALLVGTAVTQLLMMDEPVEDGTDQAERYEGTDADDRFSAAGGNDLLIGGSGDDLLDGGEGADWLLGGDGEDTLIGADGNDVIIGGAGADSLVAGAGNDFVEAAQVVNTDALHSSASGATSFSQIKFTYDLPRLSDEGDRIDLGAGDDTVVLGSDDVLTSGEGKDLISLGDWIAPGHPAQITDFDAEEDVLVYTYNAETGAPEVKLETTEDENVTALVADGVIRAYLENTSGLTADNLRLVAYSPAA